MSQFFASGGQSIGASASNEYSELISFRIDWLDLLVVQGTLKSLPQHHCSKASVLQHSAFFMVQLSHPYRTAGKTIALTRQTFVGKVMSLLFNMLSRFVIAFLPRSKHLLISWLQSPSAVILEPKKIKSVTVFIVSPSICHEVMGPDAMIFLFGILSFKPAFSLSSFTFDFPGGSDSKASVYNVGDPSSIPEFAPWVGKIPWRRKWQPTPVFLPGESHGRRSLVGYSPRGRKESDTTE